MTAPTPPPQDPTGAPRDAAATRVTVRVNGEPRELDAGSTVAEIVTATATAGNPRGVAVAVNGEVVPRSAWSATAVAEGDHIELLTAAQGG